MTTKSTTQTLNSDYTQMQFNDIDPDFPRVDDEYDVKVYLEEPVQIEFDF